MVNELQISQRGVEMPASPIRKLAPLAYAAEDKGVKIYRLNIGQPDLPTPQKALDLLKHIDRKTLEYSPSQGYRSLRKALVNYYDRYQIKLDADEIIITCGGSEAVLFAFMSCLNPGDEIIVPEPAYANYMSFAVSAGAVIKSVTTTIEEGFCLPKVEKFEELISERTKAILICNPNNPTGYLYTQKEMNQIRDLVKKYNLYLFSDEVYREFIYTGSPYISAMHMEGIEQNVVLIDSVSKRYSECGIRIGALITKNEQVRKTVMKFCQARLSPPLIGQMIAEASIEGTEQYSREVYDEYVERRKCLIDGVNRIPGCYTPVPMGAFYTVAQLPVDDTEKFCAWCLSEFCWKDEKTPEGKVGETIMMAPAAGFYSTPGMGMVYFLYDNDENDSRGARPINTFLGDFKGAIMSDAFIVYKQLTRDNPELEHCLCWAHVLCKYDMAEEISKEKDAGWFRNQIGYLYMVENENILMERTPEEIKKRRAEKDVTDTLIALHDRAEYLLRTKGSKYSDLMVTALNYMLNGWDELLNYRNDGRYTIDNLEAERTVRPITRARKTSLHHSSEDGLQMALAYMTIIETAKRFGHEIKDFLVRAWREAIYGNNDLEALLLPAIATK